MLRAFLIAIIAVSVALVPVTGGTFISFKPAQMSMPDAGDMPCCPPDDGKAAFTCMLKCFNVAGALLPAGISLPDFVDRPQPTFVSKTLYGHVSPPTHPPPI
jgi:hypothetical protein